LCAANRAGQASQRSTGFLLFYDDGPELSVHDGDNFNEHFVAA